MTEAYNSLFNALISEDPKERDNLQKALLKKIQERSGRKAIAYFANFKTHPFNMINFDDKSRMVLLIDSIPVTEEIDFILHSPGGFAETTEMIVKLLRYKFKKIRFIVPHSAKSAATMLALSGNEILMLPSAELGPIDPQVSGAVSGPAQSIIDGFKDIKKAVEQENRLNGAYVPLLNKMDVATLKQCESALEYGIKIVQEWITQYMFAEDKISSRKKKIKARSIGKYFSDHRKHLTHGKPITLEEAAKKGVKVQNLEIVDPELAKLVKEYYLRFEMIFGNIAISKIYQTENEYIVGLTPVIQGGPKISLSPLPVPPQKPVKPEAPPQGQPAQ